MEFELRERIKKRIERERAREVTQVSVLARERKEWHVRGLWSLLLSVLQIDRECD